MNCSTIKPPTVPPQTNSTLGNFTVPSLAKPFWDGSTPNGSIVCTAYPVMVADGCCKPSNGTAASLCEWTMCLISSKASYEAWHECSGHTYLQENNVEINKLGGARIECMDLNNATAFNNSNPSYTFGDGSELKPSNAQRMSAGLGVVVLALAAIAAV